MPMRRGAPRKSKKILIAVPMWGRICVLESSSGTEESDKGIGQKNKYNMSGYGDVVTILIPS